MTMINWTIQYWYGEKHHEIKSFFPGAKGDLVFLWNQDFQISLIKYYPEERRIVVSLTKHFTT